MIDLNQKLTIKKDRIDLIDLNQKSTIKKDRIDRKIRKKKIDLLVDRSFIYYWQWKNTNFMALRAP